MAEKSGAVRILPRRPPSEFGEDVKRAVEALAEMGPLAIVPFGLRARGRKEGGDVDLIVVKEGNLRWHER